MGDCTSGMKRKIYLRSQPPDETRAGNKRMRLDDIGMGVRYTATGVDRATMLLVARSAGSLAALHSRRLAVRSGVRSAKGGG